MQLKDIYRNLGIEKKARRSYEIARYRYENGDPNDVENRRNFGKDVEDYLKEWKNRVKMCLMINKQVLPEILKEIWKEGDTSNFNLLAANPNTPEDILEELYRLGYEQPLASNPNTPASILGEMFKKYYNSRKNYDMVWNYKEYSILLDIAANSNTPPEVLKIFFNVNIQDLCEEYGSDYDIRLQFYAIENPNTPEEELKKWVKQHPDMVWLVLKNSGISKEFFDELIGFERN